MLLHIIHHNESKNGVETLAESTPFKTKDEAIEYYNRLWSEYKDQKGFTEKVGNLNFSIESDNHLVSVAYVMKDVG